MPIDFNTELGQVRLNIGDVVEPYLIPDEVITAILAQYPDVTSIYRVYYTTIRCLEIIKSQYALTAARRREREGSVEIEEYSNEKFRAVCDLLNWWKDNPPEGLLPSKFAGFNFGGVRRDEVKRIKRDRNSVGVCEPTLKCRPRFSPLSFRDESRWLEE